MQYCQVVFIGSEIQIGQLLFNCVSSGFPNAAVYATCHVSSSRSVSVVLSLHWSPHAVGVTKHGFHEVAYVERLLQLWDATSSCLIANQRRFSIVDWRRSLTGGFREYPRCLSKL